MSENINENSEQNTGINVDMAPIKNNLTNLNSVMQLVNNLMQNESLLSQNPTPPVSKVSEIHEIEGLASLSEKLENIANDISDLKRENANLASLSEKLENISNDISELKKELIDVKEQKNLTKLFKKLFGMK
jgi:predicted RNase H-like nuclease (RuvC/YqgF family)